MGQRWSSITFRILPQPCGPTEVNKSTLGAETEACSASSFIFINKHVEEIFSHSWWKMGKGLQVLFLIKKGMCFALNNGNRIHTARQVNIKLSFKNLNVTYECSQLDSRESEYET